MQMAGNSYALTTEEPTTSQRQQTDEKPCISLSAIEEPAAAERAVVKAGSFAGKASERQVQPLAKGLTWRVQRIWRNSGASQIYLKINMSPVLKDFIESYRVLHVRTPRHHHSREISS